MQLSEEATIKTFNDGYVIAEYEPALAAHLEYCHEQSQSSEFLKNFFEGIGTFEPEKIHEEMLEIEQLRSSSKELDKDEREH